jgi:type IX secretion system PorP/SprF family membrane protein
MQTVFSQQDDGVVSFDLPIRNSLVFNRFAINPTFTFVRRQDKYINFTSKRENIQFDNAPETLLGSYSGRFSENIGAGVTAFQQNYGVLTTFGGVLNFAYNVKLNTDKNLTFGLNVGAYQSGVNTSNTVTNFDDPSLQNVPSNFLLTVNPGINYGTKFLDFGVSVNNLVLYNIETSTMIEEDPRQGIQAHVMHTGFFSGRGFFEKTKFTALIMSEFQKDETIISGLASLNVPKGIWFQIGYNNRFGVSGGLGLNVTKNIALEYNIEKAIGEFVDFGSSHEITLAYRFISKKAYQYSGDEKVSGLFTKKRTAPIVEATDEELEEIRDRAEQRRIQEELYKEAEALAKEKAEADAKLAAEEKAKQDAAEKVRREAEQKAKKIEAQKAKEEADLKAKIEADKIAREKAEARAKFLAEEKAKQEAEEQTKQLAEQKAREEAAKQAKLKAEQRAKDAEEKTKQEADDRAKQLADQKAKELAEAQAKLKADKEAKKLAEEKAKQLAEQRLKDLEDAKAKQLAEQKAKEDAAEKAKQLAEQKIKDAAEQKIKEDAEKLAKEELISNPKDEIGKSMLELSKETEASKTEQRQLLEDLKAIIEIKDKDLKDLKEENDLGDKGIAVAPKPFKSVTAENNKLNAIKANLDNTIKTNNDKIEELKSLFDERSRIKNTELDEVSLFYKKKIKRLTDEQLKVVEVREQLDTQLETIRIATEFEKRRRIKKAAYDSDSDRYAQDRAMLQNIKRTTSLASTPLKSEDFDFGDVQTGNIQILKNINNVENGYYLILAVHSDIKKRNDFLTKVVASGRTDVDFFYDVNTSKYYIYYNKFDSVEEANRAMEAKGNRPYNKNMSLVKIEN